MKTNKKFFNFKLYLQSFKQMKIIGIISTVIFLVLTIMLPISRVLDIKRDFSLGYITNTRVVYNVLTQNSFLIVTFVLMTPLLTLLMWNFLTKRNTSDFYHSLPYTRLCTYVSDLAAIISWQLVVMFSCAICASVVYLINQSYLIVDFGLLFRTYLAIFICNLLTTGAITLACMLTGTVFSNICVTGLILFFPRFLMLIINNILTTEVPFCVSEHTLPLIGQNSNIVSSLVCSFLTYSDDTNILISITGNIYSFILAALYLIFAGVLFVHRKSETAGKGAISGKLQFVIRAIIGSVVGSVGVMGLLSESRSSSPNVANIIFTLTITAIISALLVMVYECINSKSIRGVIKSVPSILLAYGISAAFFMIMTLSMNAILSFRPTPDSIKSISFCYGDGMYRNRTDYYQYCSSKISINESHIKEILCNALNDNLDAYDNDRMDYVLRREDVTVLQVTFRQGGLPKYRTVYVPTKQFNELGKYLKEIKEYKDAFLDLPSSEEVSINWQFNNRVGLNPEEGNQLYDQLIKESREIDFEDWYQNLYSSNGVLYAEVQFMRDGHPYIVQLDVTDKLPETMKMYLKFVNESNNNASLKKELADVLISYGSGNKRPVSERVSLLFYDPVSGTTNDTSLILLSSATEKGPETIQKLGKAVADSKAGDQIDVTRPYVIVNYYSTGDINATVKDEYDDYYTNYEEVSYAVQLDGYDLITDYYPVNMGY